MTQEPGATKTLSTILRNSATISTQQVLQLQQDLEKLKQVVEQQQLELMKLRQMQIYYRPPTSEEHLKLQDVLTELWEKTHNE